MAVPAPESAGEVFRPMLALLLAAGLALAVALAGEWSYNDARTSLNGLAQRAEVRTAIHLVLRRLLDAETAQRGYLLTGREAYLEPREQASLDIGNAIQRLKRHYAGEPDVAAQVETLERRVMEKMSEVDETLSLHAAGKHDQWRELMLTDIGREKMEAVRKAADALLVIENRRVVNDRTHVYRTLSIARLGVFAVAAMALLWLVIFMRKNAALTRAQRHYAARLKEERDNLEVQVLQRTAELSELNHHLQDVREFERSRLARTLHDELGSLMTAAKLDLARLRRALPAPSTPVLERLDHLARTIDLGIGLKRRIIEDLMPSALHNLGLVPALEILAGDFTNRTAVPVDLALDDGEVPDSARIVLFRLVQEGLDNIERHAKASHVSVSTRIEGGRLFVRVEDDGVGFEPGRGVASGHGLRGLHHRIAALGGKVTVDSAPGRGTRIEASIPKRLAGWDSPGPDDTIGRAMPPALQAPEGPPAMPIGGAGGAGSAGSPGAAGSGPVLRNPLATGLRPGMSAQAPPSRGWMSS